MLIKPIKRSTISNLVFEQIRQAIMNGEWAAGTKIPSENELSKMFSVSRISIREALQKLVTLGILETRRGEGTYIKQLTNGLYMNSLIPMLILEKPGVMEILEFRKIFEVESAGLAALRADEEDINNLQVILDEMYKSKENIKKHSADDLNFHFEIAKMTKNPIIVKVNYILKDILASVLQDIVTALGCSRGIFYHKKIFDAIKMHDSQLAKQLMGEHIDNTINSMLDKIEECVNSGK